MSGAALTDYWRKRSQRERAMLLAGGLVILAALVYALAVQPLIAAGRKAEAGLPELRRQAAEMRRLADDAGRLKARAGVAVARPDAATLSASARGAGLAPRLDALPDGGFAARLERVSFTALGEWLARLQAEQRLFVRSARIQATGDGNVNAELVLAP